MGQASRDRTDFIFNSLLTLGVLENSNNGLTKNEILVKLLDVYDERVHVQRCIDHIELWLKDGGENLVQNGRRGREKVYKLNSEQLFNNGNKYIDFLEVLLRLNEIQKEQPDSAIKNLYGKNGDKPLGIVAHLILAIRQKSKLIIEYEGLDQEFVFYPITITRSPEKYLVEGKRHRYQEIHELLEISKILKLTLAN